MWPFHRHTSLKDCGIFDGFTDWHCHILPCVDDGVQTMEESLEILRRYEQLGVSTVWLTPHIMEDVPNTPDALRQRYAELKSAYQGSITLHLAAENMLDSLFEQRLGQNDLLPIGNGGDHLLVETSYFNPPMGFHGLLESIKRKGYYPVLAHPERYTYMAQADYHELKSMGILFQLNIFSLIGFYGPVAKKKAEWLLSNGMYNLSGSDIHRVLYLEKPIHLKMQAKLSQLLRHTAVAELNNA